MLNSHLREVAEAHVKKLARRHQIRVRRTKNWINSEADFVTRQIFCPAEFRTGLDYLIALHEIGHLMTPDAEPHIFYEPGIASVLRDEAAAWGWALEHADPDLIEAMTKTDWRRVGHCWISHAGRVW
jgi:hypothetical protein